MLGYPRLLLVLRVCVLVACLAPSANAQSIDDGQMIRPRELLTGTVFSYDSWDEYWEGPLKRTNGNIGRITTRTTAWMANYGLSERLNIIGQAPYVQTSASRGVIHGIQRFQDVTRAAKDQ